MNKAKLLICLILSFVFVLSASFQIMATSEKYDLNNDGAVNICDLVVMKKIISKQPQGDSQLSNVDVIDGNTYFISDLTNLVCMLLGKDTANDAVDF